MWIKITQIELRRALDKVKRVAMKGTKVVSFLAQDPDRVVCMAASIDDTIMTDVTAINTGSGDYMVVDIVGLYRSIKMLPKDSIITINDMGNGEAEIASSDFKKKLPKDSVVLTKDVGNKTEVSVVIIAYPVNEYVAERHMAKSIAWPKGSFSLPALTMYNLIKKTISSATGGLDNAPAYEMALFEIDRNTARMVSVDGHRISLAEESVSGELPKTSVIIRYATLIELKKTLRKKGTIDIAFEKEEYGLYHRMYLRYKWGRVVLSSELADTKFPPYQKVIPGSFISRFHLDRLELIGLLKSMSNLISNGCEKRVILNFDKDLAISAFEPFNDAELTMKLLDSKMCDNSFTIGFEIKYLLDALRCIESNGVIMEFNEQLDPGVITSDRQECFTAVVMPLVLG
jgi:DNA polymerase-3 subunit beta